MIVFVLTLRSLGVSSFLCPPQKVHQLGAMHIPHPASKKSREGEFGAEVHEKNPTEETPAFIPPDLPDAHFAHGTPRRG
jgi:hypothetical protein